MNQTIAVKEYYHSLSKQPVMWRTKSNGYCKVIRIEMAYRNRFWIYIIVNGSITRIISEGSQRLTIKIVKG